MSAFFQLQPGDMCGAYEIERELGRGGMAIVYLANSPEGEPRAIKTLQFDAALDPDQVGRFKREIKLLASIDDVHVVRFYEAGRVERSKGGSLMWVALEYLEGQRLRQIIDERGGRIAPEDIARWCKHIADGVIAAHALGVIHRDLKPSNVAIVHDMAKVFDFGIAKFRKWGIKATDFRTRLGTVGYMPPEQLAGNDVDERADVFALGVILHELATGTHPILPSDRALTPPEMVARCFTVAPASLTELVPGFPEDLAAIARRAMAKSRDDRFASMAAMRDALDHALESQRASRRPLAMGPISGGWPAFGPPSGAPVHVTVPIAKAPVPIDTTVALESAPVAIDEEPAARRQPARAEPMAVVPPPSPSLRGARAGWGLRAIALVAGAVLGLLVGMGVLALARQLGEGIQTGSRQDASRAPAAMAAYPA